MSVDLDLYILSRNRLDYLITCVNSVLDQEVEGVRIKIIISDNSSDDSVEQYFGQNKISDNIKYLRRFPELSAADHLKTIINESKSEFIILFHDDDVFCNNYIYKMMEAISKYNVGAVGCNAIIFRDYLSNIVRLSYTLRSPTLYNDKYNFLSRYLPGSTGISPFSSYIYRRSALKKIDYEIMNFGKHLDAIFLAEIASKDGVLLLPQVLIKYRLHSLNDSNVESIKDRRIFINYLLKAGFKINDLRIYIYRFMYIYKLSMFSTRRKHKLIVIIFCKLALNFLNTSIYKSFIYKYIARIRVLCLK